MIEYRGHLIEHNPSEEYSRNWLWWEKAYLGPDDTRCGASESFEAAKFDIDDRIACLESGEKQAPFARIGEMRAVDAMFQNRSFS